MSTAFPTHQQVDRAADKIPAGQLVMDLEDDLL